MITSGGNRNPAKPDRGGGTRPRRRPILPPCPRRHPSTQQTPWTAQRRGGNGSVADFLALIQRVSGKNVDNLAQTWLFSPTRPPSPPPDQQHHPIWSPSVH